MQKMDMDEAMDLVKKGSTLLLLDVPQLTLVGIDTQIFSVGPLFKGIKMIPPGPHFVYYSSANREGSDFSPVVGFFITTTYSEVIVRKWNQQEERLVKLLEEEPLYLRIASCIESMANIFKGILWEAWLPKLPSYLIVFIVRDVVASESAQFFSSRKEASYISAVKQLEFDHQLGPYPLDHFLKWKSLSNYITKETIGRLEPIGGEISVAYEPLSMETIPQKTLARDVQQLGKDTMSSPTEKLKKRSCYYTPIPRVIKRKDTSQEELTSLNLDKTALLETILKDNYGDSTDLLLGELQFSFVAFLMGQSLEAFFQWKGLVSLLFSCTEAPLHTRSQMFTKFISILYYQLKHGYNEDRANTSGSNKGFSFFLEESWFSKDIFLYHLCKEFFSLTQEADIIDGDLLTWTKKLKKLLETTFGWEYRDTISDMIYDEDDEFAPVVVPSTDISAEGSSSL